MSSPVLVKFGEKAVIIYDFTELMITGKSLDNFPLNRNIFFIKMYDYFTKT